MRTFTYCKPLVLHADRPPEELDRLDSKNWSPTPDELQDRLIRAVEALAAPLPIAGLTAAQQSGGGLPG